MFVDNYFGVFDCFSPSRGCVRTLIMRGVFSVDDLFRVNIMLVKEFNDEKSVVVEKDSSDFLV